MTTMMLRASLAAAAIALGAFAAGAQDYPTRYIRIVVGPGLDSPARIFGAKIAEALGQQVVVEPRPGAGGTIAAQTVANAAPDGYTLMLATAAYTINTALKRSPVDLRTDLAPIGLVTTVKYALVVHPSVPVHTLQELIAYAKANPGKLNYSSSGIGTPPHLAGEMLKSMTGINIVHVPYRNANDAMNAVVSGAVQLLFSLAQTAQPQIAAGLVRGLGESAKEASPFVPGVKPIAELGLPDFDVLGWNGIVAPRDTPAPIIAKLSAAIQKAADDPDVHKQVFDSGYETAKRNTPEEFGKFIAADTQKWIDLIEKMHIKAQ